jgi:hypothetical protein
MKYLKIFEEMENRFYEEISNSRWHTLYDRLLNFNQDEVNRLKDVIDLDKFPKSKRYTANTQFFKNVRGELTNAADRVELSDGGDTKLFIYKKEDEYYLVELTSIGYVIALGDGPRYGNRYLCDQWDGLVRLLKDKGYLK